MGFESASSCFIYYLTYIVHVIKGKISILVPQMYPKGPGRPSSIIFQSNSSKCGAFESCTSQTYLTRWFPVRCRGVWEKLFDWLWINVVADWGYIIYICWKCTQLRFRRPQDTDSSAARMARPWSWWQFEQTLTICPSKARDIAETARLWATWFRNVEKFPLINQCANQDPEKWENHRWSFQGASKGLLRQSESICLQNGPATKRLCHQRELSKFCHHHRVHP